MSDKVPPDEPLTRTEAEGATVDLPEGLGIIATGQVEGDRYEIMEMLGRGGMGEVWHAFDLKLRVEVALKALREDLFRSERRLELLRQEVRAAREVVSPNVCRIFDLIEVDGRELVSMEYVDGATLLGVLQERGPLELKEAQDIASQFLAGLEAIHKAGLVHRDVKPENIMLTRAGRVVVMDFGLARQEAEGGGSASGTPAYMAPEHAAGDQVDARADVYSAGVVLAEMVSPDGIKSMESRSSVWKGVRAEPAQIPDSPWAPVIERAVARDRERRPNSAHTLIRELESVTMRVESAEGLHPYPGLASFTEEDAEYFFGREAEIEQMWRRLEGPTRMLALVGPSGAGKTSFAHAGLLPTRRPGWSHIVCTPGSDPRASLRRAVISELEDDAEAIRELAVGDDDSSIAAVERWARRSDHALVVVDQFEELFTQNSTDEQHRFTTLLGRLALDADVFVLVSMRDDFLFHCHRYEALRPVLSDLTMLGPPQGAALRRALVQPATKCGYRFEDDALVDEMLAEVEGERGALPMLAFAASRLWERRDSQSGLLTRQATIDIGGVSGALARHAEATIDLIGVERIPIVRELFRNLVTAEGTRAVREWDELLSIFSDSRSESQEVLRALVDARLLTSYEIREGDQEPTRMVEIIHESLLANWPRLVRWQTQDADAIQVREQLRQAAKTWDDNGRIDDLLWAGSAYRQYSVWRESYSGGLTDVEDAFASAMTTIATRRTRRRRAVAAAAIIVATAVALVFANLWRRSVAETRRAEAAGLIALGQLELESYPTTTVAHAIASLELADSYTARHLALEALWKGPLALVVPENQPWRVQFSPDGRSLVRALLRETDDPTRPSVVVFRQDGSSTPLQAAHPPSTAILDVTEISSSGHFSTISQTESTDTSEKLVLRSIHRPEPLATTTLSKSQNLRGTAIDARNNDQRMLVLDGNRYHIENLGFDGTRKRLGSLSIEAQRDGSGRLDTVACLDKTHGSWLGVVSKQSVYTVEIGTDHVGVPRIVGRRDGTIPSINCDPRGRFVVSLDQDGSFAFWNRHDRNEPVVVSASPRVVWSGFNPNGGRFLALSMKDGKISAWVWDTDGDRPRFLRTIDQGTSRYAFPGSRHFASSGPGTGFRYLLLNGPADAEPIPLKRGDTGQQNHFWLHPNGEWLATADNTGMALWPLRQQYPIEIKGQVGEGRVTGLIFAPDGTWLASSSDTVRLWPLIGDPPQPGKTLHGPSHLLGLAASPDGQKIVVGHSFGETALISLEDGAQRTLDGFDHQSWGVAFSPDGRLVAAIGGQFVPEDRVIRIWDASTGDEVKALEIGENPYVNTIQFVEGGFILAVSESGLFRWDIESGERVLLYPGTIGDFAASKDGRRVLLGKATDTLSGPRKLILLDVESNTSTTLEQYGDEIRVVACDASASIVATSDSDDEIRVGLVDGAQPHLFLGSQGTNWSLAIDPLGRWIASGGEDGTIRLWPMPDLSKPPLHTLPREELIAKLKTLTNLRVVRDPDSAAGWTLTHDPFPGWETVPTW